MRDRARESEAVRIGACALSELKDNDVSMLCQGMIRVSYLFFRRISMILNKLAVTWVSAM